MSYSPEATSRPRQATYDERGNFSKPLNATIRSWNHDEDHGPSEAATFDASRYLTDDGAIAEYIDAVLEDGNPDLLLLALGDVARARGMAQVAKDAGLGRESLYKALSPGAKPRFETVMKVARALGVRLTAQPM